jgi:hypothetical protein
MVMALLYAGLLLGTASLAALPGASATQPEDHIRVSVTDQGKRMKADIFSTYKQLKAARSLKYAADGGSDVTALITKYVGLGTPIADAIGVLHEAGFLIETSDQGVVDARANVGGGFPEFKASEVEVILQPKTEQVPAVVGSLSAQMFRRYVVNTGK